jgi:anaerobic ribonucleoside-triphosphate reductase activating protein
VPTAGNVALDPRHAERASSGAHTHELRVGGLVALSTTDYPDQLAAVVFCQGCPWRCGYCHNPHLLPKRGTARIVWRDVLAFLERRRGLLDAVVFSGGEPTLQAALHEAMQAVKSMGYKVGLHTAGIVPTRLERVLPLVDWVGMDVKTEFDRYAEVTGVPGSGMPARRSVELILASGVAHEFRTTVHPMLVSRETLERLAQTLARLGVRRYVLQEFRKHGCHAQSLINHPPAGCLDAALQRKLEPHFVEFAIRSTGQSPVF